MPARLQKAADFAASLIRDGADFRNAVTQASQRFSEVEWRDIQHELTYRSLQMRAPRRPPESPPEPAPEEPTEPEADQGKFGFMDETRRVIRNILFETNGASGGSGGTGGGASGAGGATGSGAASSGAGGTGNGANGGSGGNGGTNMDGGDGEPDSTTMMPMKSINLGHRFGIGYYPYRSRKKGCKHGRRKDGKCRKAPKTETRAVMRSILGKSQPITLLAEGAESDHAVARHPAVREWADLPGWPEILGSGSFGTVFETNNPNVVLKISSDYEEFQAVSRLLDDSALLTNVVEVYEAAVVNTGTDEKYAILEERLVKLEAAGVRPSLVEDFSAALHYYTADKAGKLPRRGNFHTVMSHYWETNEVERFQRWLQQTPPHPEPVEYESGIDDPEYEQDAEWWEEEKQYKREWATTFGEDGPGEGIANDIIEGLEQLQSHGIKYGDIHPGNIMVHPRGGQFKITDIGISDTSGDTEVRPELVLQDVEDQE